MRPPSVKAITFHWLMLIFCVTMMALVADHWDWWLGAFCWFMFLGVADDLKLWITRITDTD